MPALSGSSIAEAGGTKRCASRDSASVGAPWVRRPNRASPQWRSGLHPRQWDRPFDLVEARGLPSMTVGQAAGGHDDGTATASRQACGYGAGTVTPANLGFAPMDARVASTT